MRRAHADRPARPEISSSSRSPIADTTLPVHVGGSSTPAARRPGQRGDGYFAGGALLPDERAAQWEPARAAATEAGRDPDRLEYTRWSGFDMTGERLAAFTAQGVDGW
ncbi:LLM class flavin-dependent oxidoreductase [Nocardia flavorosea]|uniref:LLM class flavin-dependent oxidoreductase n=1 Tax=Nocardia flavorosea TaxID=53429 RepID=UPI001B350F68